MVFEISVAVILIASAASQILQVRSHNELVRAVKSQADRITALENHPEITKAATCSWCLRQVARYYPTPQGRLLCANCDPHGFEKYFYKKK